MNESSPMLSPEEAESLFGPASNGPASARRAPRSPDPQPKPVVDIQPIETAYAGCRFRSRLEARWAVFFDRLGIEWLYEPESYTVGPFGARRGYVPDFYLPRWGVWVEVKGHADALDADLLLRAASPTHGLPLRISKPERQYGLWELRLLLLGPVPRRPAAHDLLAVIGGEVVVAQFGFFICGSQSGRDHAVVPVYAPSEPATAAQITDGLSFREGYELGFSLCQHVQDAFRAARMARFEHGESGAPEVLPEPVMPVVKPRRTRRAARKASAKPVSTDESRVRYDSPLASDSVLAYDPGDDCPLAPDGAPVASANGGVR